MADAAVFLDRDGTLIEEVGYASRPEQIRILGGVGRALAGLAEGGYKLIVVTNQSGMARGLSTEEDLERFHQALDEQLDMLGVRLDAYYVCPHHPDLPNSPRPDLVVECDCRKPKPGLILQAAEDFRIDLSASWTVGDTWRDIAAGQAAGVKTIKLPADADHDFARPPDVGLPTAEADSLAEAARIILGITYAEADLVSETPETEEEQTEEPPDETMEEPSSEEVSGVTETQESAQVEDAAPHEENIEDVQEAQASEDVEAVGVLEQVPDEQPSDEPGPETSEEKPVVAPEGASRLAAMAGQCARCGQDVSASDLADEKAGERDGFLLCSECLARHPRESAGAFPNGEEDLLRSMLVELRRMNRARQRSGLTWLCLLAYVVQAGALFCGLVLGLVSEDRALYIQLAVFLQLVVVALVLFERRP